MPSFQARERHTNKTRKRAPTKAPRTRPRNPIWRARGRWRGLGSALRFSVPCGAWKRRWGLGKARKMGKQRRARETQKHAGLGRLGGTWEAGSAGAQIRVHAAALGRRAQLSQRYKARMCVGRAGCTRWTAGVLGERARGPGVREKLREIGGTTHQQAPQS